MYVSPVCKYFHCCARVPLSLLTHAVVPKFGGRNNQTVVYFLLCWRGSTCLFCWPLARFNVEDFLQLFNSSMSRTTSNYYLNN